MPEASLGRGYSAGATIIAVAATTATLMWVAVINGFPLLYGDSLAYYVNGRDVALALTTLTNHGVTAPGKSIFYGFFVYLVSYRTSFWSLAVAQSLLVALMLLLVVRKYLVGIRPAYAIFVVIVTALFSSLSWFATYVMADIFASLMMLAITLACLGELARHEALFVFGLLFVSCLFHASIAVCAVAVIVALFLVNWRWRRVETTTLALLAVTITGAVGTLVLSSYLVTGKLGLAINQPPFFLARIIADGPGRQYLRESCDERHYVLCPMVETLPDNTEDMLWSKIDYHSPFDRLGKAGYERLLEEQAAVITGTFRSHPGWTLAVMTANFSRQLVTFGLGDFYLSNQYFGVPDTTLQRLLLSDYPRYKRSLLAAYEDHPSATAVVFLKLMSRLQLLFVLLGAAVLALVPLSRRADRPYAVAMLVVAAGLLSNALVNGVISGVLDRLQSRVVWLIPFFGALYAARMFAADRAVRARARCD